jgi:hypothetical protein
LAQKSKSAIPTDIAAILKSKKDELDLDNIEGWAARLGLSSLWKEIPGQSHLNFCALYMGIIAIFSPHSPNMEIHIWAE